MESKTIIQKLELKSPVKLFINIDLFASGETFDEAKNKIMDRITSKIMELDKIHSDLAHDNYEVK